MKSINNKLIAGATAALLASTSSYADNTSDIALLKKQIAQLMQQLENQSKQTQALETKSNQLELKSIALEEQSQALIDETSDLKTGFNYTKVDTTKSYSGMGAAASKVYYSKSPLSIGGYAKVDYYHQSKEGVNDVDNIDVYRFIPYIGYKFTDNIIMNAEIEFEHGGIKDGAAGDGYVIMEFLYLDFLFNKNFNLRVGNQLMPMGLLNQKHEPTLFTTVQRPNTSKKLIPSTWHENGVMAYGKITDDLAYQVGAFSGLQLSKGAGEGNDWLRDSRLGSFRADSAGGERLGLALSGRLDYTGINGLLLGASTYVDSNVIMGDVHFDYSQDAFRTYGVYTMTDRTDTVTGEPERAQGGFVNFSYDMRSMISGFDKKLPVFFQYETVSAQDKVTNGASVDSTDTATIGINFFPHEQIVLKADYAMTKDNSKASSQDETNIFSLSMGFVF
ncbi:porin [Sulfurimonas sp.]|nr:porin [Sulfurimonas sp.]